MDIMNIFNNEIIKTLAYIISVCIFLYVISGFMAVSGRGLVKAAENNYELQAIREEEKEE